MFEINILTRTDRLESPEGVSLGQKCSNLSAERTLHVNTCNQYVINLITQSIVDFQTVRLSGRWTASGFSEIFRGRVDSVLT